VNKINKELIDIASEHNGVITSKDVTHIGKPANALFVAIYRKPPKRSQQRETDY